MNRKGIAEETVAIVRQGGYRLGPGGPTVDISAQQKFAEDNSELIGPEEGEALLSRIVPPATGRLALTRTIAEATVKAIRDLQAAVATGIGVLNFASARNPGGGFLNGAMAQEESLAASSGLYETQLRHMDYYKANRACRSLMYTEHAIYSPWVPFIRDERFKLTDRPALASVLTLPAVNFGEANLKGEDRTEAKHVMKNRMRRALAIFADKGDRTLVLGAYGCGVFRNDPADVAGWWRELLEDEGYGRLFDEIVFAVLDKSSSQACIREFEAVFP